MAKYEYNGQKYELPDDVPEDEAINIILQDQGNQPGLATAPTNETPAENPNKNDPEYLQYDQNWLDAARIVYEKNNNKPFDGTPQDLAEYGLDQMGWFNYNLPTMAVDAARIARADEDHKQAFLYLMNRYDDLEMSWGGVGRFIKGAMLDPTTYVGLSTLGVGAVGGQATKLASKEALKQMLKTGLVTGLEGAMQTAASNSIEQSVRINAGERAGFDYGELAGEAATGFGVGAALGGAADALGTAIRKAPEMPAKAPEASPGTTLAGEPTTPAPEAPRANSESSDPEAIQLELPWGEGAKPAGNPDNEIIKAAESTALDSGQRAVPRSQADISEWAKPATDVILNAKPEEIARMVEEARRAKVTGETDTNLKGALADATEILMRKFMATTDPAERKAIYEGQLQVIRDADLALSSVIGSDLANRVGKINTGALRDINPDALMLKKGIDPLMATEAQKLDALNEFHEILVNQAEAVAKRGEVQELDKAIQEAFDTGDYGRAAVLGEEKQTLLEKIIELEPDPEAKERMQLGRQIVKGMNEYVISTVFTPKTVLVNTIPAAVKTMYRPGLDFVMRGMDGKAYRQMTAAYSAMAANQSAALKAAAAAFRYEAAMLNGDFTKEANRILEESPVLPRKYLGGVLRIFPRMLGTTDEYFSQLNYRSYVASSAAGRAYEVGLAKGMKGEALDAFVKQETINAIEHSFASSVDAPKVVGFLRQQGISNGLSGAKLQAYIERELGRNPDMFREATNQTGIDFANDMAFKRPFSGEGRWGTSRIAKDYEDLVNRYPIMRLMGQLFFRTPVRVFEEGFRLTAGLNLVTPGFISDLRGANGPAKQLRAQGELLLSQAIAASVFTAYANGAITGGVLDDWKAKRSMQGGDWEPYTITFPNGDKFSFRNLDPFATPLKIIVNALDRYSLLEVRRAQGEDVNKETNEVLAFLSIATLSIGQAIRDASLTEGIDQITQFFQNMADPENNENQLLRFIAQKGQLLVPNVIGKVGQQFDPVLNDPATIEQFMRARVNPGDPKVPRRYDAMGNEVKLANPGSALYGIDYTTTEQREAVTDPKRVDVSNALRDLTVATGRTFIAPYDAQAFASIPGMKGWQGVDLRSRMVKDGSESMYDRLQRYVRETGVTDQLHAALVDNQLGTVGRPGIVGSRVEIATELLKSARRQAFVRLMAEDSGFTETWIAQEIEEANVKAGFRDVRVLPFQGK